MHVTFGLEAQFGELSMHGTDLFLAVTGLDDGLPDGSDPEDCFIDRNKIFGVIAHKHEKFRHGANHLRVCEVCQEVLAVILDLFELKSLLVPFGVDETQEEIHVAKGVLLGVNLLHNLEGALHLKKDLLKRVEIMLHFQ